MIKVYPPSGKQLSGVPNLQSDTSKENLNVSVLVQQEKVQWKSVIWCLNYEESMTLLPTASEGWGKVLFSHVSVRLSVCPPPPRDLLHGGRYASCVHAGGLSCSY